MEFWASFPQAQGPIFWKRATCERSCKAARITWVFYGVCMEERWCHFKGGSPVKLLDILQPSKLCHRWPILDLIFWPQGITTLVKYSLLHISCRLRFERFLSKEPQGGNFSCLLFGPIKKWWSCRPSYVNPVGTWPANLRTQFCHMQYADKFPTCPF